MEKALASWRDKKTTRPGPLQPPFLRKGLCHCRDFLLTCEVLALRWASRLALGGSRNLPPCWAATELSPVSSEWPPGRPKLNKGLPELAGVAACQAWLSTSTRGWAGQKPWQWLGLPSCLPERETKAHGILVWHNPLEGAAGNQWWLSEQPVPFWNLWKFVFFTMRAKYKKNNDESSG